MRSRTKRLIYALAIPVVLSTGCSTTNSLPLSNENRTSIKSVYIDKNVAKPKAIYWRGTMQAWGGTLFGAVGGAATSNAGMTDAALMVKFMEKEHIDLSEIVYSEVSKQVAALKIFRISDSNNADARLIFFVDMYGFNKTQPFGSHMNPLIRITGKLIKPNNEIVWQESEFVTDFASENDQGQSLDTYQSDPTKLRAALVKVSEVAVKRVVSKLP